MRYFSIHTAKKILTNEISPKELLVEYPEYKEEILQEIQALKTTDRPSLFQAIVKKYTTSAKIAENKINKSRLNEKTIQAFLPDIIKARLAIYLLEQLNIIASSSSTGNVRLNFWDGTILQKLLFKKGLERKLVPVKKFNFFWKFIKNKRILMPLVNKQGIYCFYSKELISECAKLIGEEKCLEIGAGDGTLTHFISTHNTKCIATDDYSWGQYISYPSFVEKADAKTALQKHKPKAVICSWPVPKNSYEKHVFKTASVDLYIVIGTKNATLTGDFETYHSINNFTIELNEYMSSLILPPSNENAVYIFRRIQK